MGGYAHEAVALDDVAEGFALALADRQIEGAQLIDALCAVLDVLQAPVAQRDDGGLLLGEEGGCLIVAQAQGVLAEDAAGEQVINPVIGDVDVGALCKGCVHLGHVVPVLAVAVHQSGHELHEGVVGPLVLGAQGNGHEVGVGCAEVVLQLGGCGLEVAPGGGNFHAGFLKHILPVVDVLVAGGHGNAQNLAVHGVAGGQGVVLGGLGVGQVQQVILEPGQGEGLVEHDVGQLVGRGAHLHGVPVLAVVLDLFHFDFSVGVLLLELAHHVVGVDVFHQVVVPDGENQFARELAACCSSARSSSGALGTAAGGQTHGGGSSAGNLQKRAA